MTIRKNDGRKTVRDFLRVDQLLSALSRLIDITTEGSVNLGTLRENVSMLFIS